MAEMPTVHDPNASGEAMPTGSSVSAVGDPEVAAAVERFSDGAVEARFAEQVEERRVEFDAIVGMLLLQTTPGVDPAQAEVVARAIAAGCLGEQHLWRDLELPNRGVLRRLFEAYFEPFAADNLMDMRVEEVPLPQVVPVGRLSHVQGSQLWRVLQLLGVLRHAGLAHCTALATTYCSCGISGCR